MSRPIRISISVTGVVNARVDVESNGTLLMSVHEHQSDSKFLSWDPEESLQLNFMAYSHVAGPWKAHMRVTVNSSSVFDKELSGHADRGSLGVFDENCYPV